MGDDGTAGVEGAMPVTGDLDNDLGDNWIIAAKGMVTLRVLAAVAEPAFIAPPVPRQHLRSAFTAHASCRATVT
jgi:hypothetical protein